MQPAPSYKFVVELDKILSLRHEKESCERPIFFSRMTHLSKLPSLLLPPLPVLSRLTSAISSGCDQFPWTRLVIPRELLDSVWSTGRTSPPFLFSPFHSAVFLDLSSLSFFLSFTPGFRFRIRELDPPIRAEQRTTILIRRSMRLKIRRRAQMNWRR